jgi:hypothetical protein
MRRLVLDSRSRSRMKIPRLTYFHLELSTWMNGRLLGKVNPQTLEPEKFHELTESLAEPYQTMAIVAMRLAADLAETSRNYPWLRIMVNAGYDNLATTLFASQNEEKHLSFSQPLASNSRSDCYESGRIAYVRVVS